MARYHVPGVALGVIDGDAAHVAGFGVTSVEDGLPVDGQTPFQIASITKTVVATAVLRLVERGQLELDAPVQRYLPELRLREASSTERLTLAHLLEHTAGFQGDVRDGDFGVRCGAGDDALAQFVGMVAHLPQHALPGERWAYNNAGFCLAGRVTEVVTGELVLEPLGMRRSGFSVAGALAQGVAGGHRVKDGRAEVALRLTLVPERRFGIFVLTNADMGAQLHAEVTKQALREYVGIAGLDVTPLPAPPADLGQYAGTYGVIGPDDERIDVRMDGDRLLLSEVGAAAFYAPDHIVALEGLWRHERGEFLRGSDGRITYLRMVGALCTR